MEIVLAVTAGCILDMLFGDPQWMPHPIRFLGWMISTGEKLFRRLCKDQKSEYFLGAVLSICVISMAYLIPFFILYWLWNIDKFLAIVVHGFMCYQILAAKSLKTESMKVFYELEKNDIVAARQKLSWIVSRDTAALDRQQIAKSTVETISENTSDGVIAPLIFLLIGGAPLGLMYKAINTLDSMIGYKNDQYIWFGRFAAKMDDAANYLPARISAWLMIAASFVCGYDAKNALKIYRRDKHNHTSPNSAQTEAVCAGALRIQIAGPNYYFGKRIDKPTIGDDLRPVENGDIKRANRLMYATFVLTGVLGIAVRLILWKLGY